MSDHEAEEVERGNSTINEENGDDEGAEQNPQPPACLNADGTIDYMRLAFEAVVPMAWNGYVLYVVTKKQGGINKMIEDSMDPAIAFQKFTESLNLIKETLNAARSK